MKKLRFIFLFPIFLIISGCNLSQSDSRINQYSSSTTTTSTSKTKSQESYKETVSNFNKIGAEAVINMNLEFPSILYFGRETCPYCREIVSELNQVSKKENILVYYVDTENLNLSTQESLDNLTEKYNVEYVPNILFFKSKDEFVTYNDESQKSLEKWIKIVK